MNTIDKVRSMAVLIDADNVSPSLVDEIFRIVGSFGDPIVRRAYGMVGCFSGGGGWQLAQREYGVVAKPQVSNISGKNVADIALKTVLKKSYHVPISDIQPVIGTLQSQRVIKLDKAGMVTVCNT